MVASGTAELDRPLLIYDGDCEFCRYCVDYARAITGAAIDYRPLQQAASAFPVFSEQDYRASIRLLEPDGSTCAGAAAAFRTLELGGGNRGWSRLYRASPAFAAVAEWTYHRVAQHRAGVYRVCRGLFGPVLRPARVDLTCWIFLRLLALVYLAAFGSLAAQAPGLIGDQGILPSADFLRAVAAEFGPERFALFPSLLWLDASTATILSLCLAGCGLSLCLLFDRGTRWVLPCLYLLYLSLYHGGQRFLSYQWDILLLECGVLAMFLPAFPRLGAWLYRWLLFRFMLQSGLVKLLSGDPTWRDYSALSYHFETQPLPGRLAWYANQLPDTVLQAGVAFTFLVELIVPFLILMPRRPRQLAAVLIAFFQLAILGTGNYNFFNLLTLCLCLLLLDDQCLRSRASSISVRDTGSAGRAAAWSQWLAGIACAVYLGLSVLLLGFTGNRAVPGPTSRALLFWSQPWHLANGYGLFAVMTTERREIVFEGSRDGESWLAYELPYKPGDPHRAPGWAIPHQPRLDWQLWFAALQAPSQNAWVGRVTGGLLRDSGPITALFEHNPFPEAPPQYVRASLYRYHFTTGAERRQTGAWWRREYLGEYWPTTAWRLPVERVR